MTIGSATSFTAGFVILTAGLAVTGAALMIFILTNGRAVRTAEYGFRIGRFIATFAVGWLLVDAGFATVHALTP